MSEIRLQATPARDELAARDIDRFALAELIHVNVCHRNLENCEGECNLTAKEAVTDGWSKPRTVDSAAELHTLPVESVVRNANGWIGEISIVSGKPVIFWIGNECEDELKDIALPATVLFTPGDAG